MELISRGLSLQTGTMKCLVEVAGSSKNKGRGLKGFDCVCRIKGSVPVQAGDHR